MAALDESEWLSNFSKIINSMVGIALRCRVNTWGSPAKEYGEEARPQPKEFCWVGTEAQKFLFPDGMITTPLTWSFLGQAIPTQAWSGSTCACVSEDGSEVSPAVCVGFTIDSPSLNP